MSAKDKNSRRIKLPRRRTAREAGFTYLGLMALIAVMVLYLPPQARCGTWC